MGRTRRGRRDMGSDPIGSVYEYLHPELTRRDLAGLPEPKKTLLGLPTGGLTHVMMGDVTVGVPINMVDHCDYGGGGRSFVGAC